MLYFQTLLNQALGGIDGTSIITTVVSIAYGILLVGFLIGLYQAVMRGGDVRALAGTAIKYLVIAVIIANWTTAFRDVNNSFNGVSQAIANSSGAGDMFQSWSQQLAQQLAQNPKLTFWALITGDPAGMITSLLLVLAFLIYGLAYIIFCFFYALFGALLYALGPVVLALLPIQGVGQLAKSYATNLMIWNAWGLIYGVFAALITAIHYNDVNNVLSNGFLGFLSGQADSIILGMVSIFYALAIALIPFIAKRIISGDVGSTAVSLAVAGATAAGAVLAGAAGFAAGAGATGSATGASSASGSASGLTANNWTGTGQFGNASTTASTSSSMAPPTPGLGQSIRSGIASAVGNRTPISSQTSNGAGSSASSSSRATPASSRPSSSSSGSPGWTYRPTGVTQNLAYQAGRGLGRVVRGARSGND